MNKGEIWWATLREPRGSEPGYRRPVVIIQSDAFNHSLIATVICAVITTNLTLAQAPGNILLKTAHSRLPRDSVINVSQLLTVDRQFFTECIGHIGQEMLTKVENGLKLVLGL